MGGHPDGDGVAGVCLDEAPAPGAALEKAREAHDSAVKKLSEKKGNILGTADKLRELGAKTEKRLSLNGRTED